MLPRYSAQLGTVAGEDQSHIHSCRLWAGRSISFLTDLPGDGQGVSTLTCSGDPSSCCESDAESREGNWVVLPEAGGGHISFSQIFHPASWWEIQSYLVVLEVRQEHLQHVLPMSSCEALGASKVIINLWHSALLPAENGPHMDPGPYLSCLWSWTSLG